MNGEAFISDDGAYRHWLSRVWGPPPVIYPLWVGLNPSTADATQDDPTIRREVAFTKSWGYNSYFKVNICDYRATNPKKLLEVPFPRSSINLEQIDKLAKRADKIILCYGAIHSNLEHYFVLQAQ